MPALRLPALLLLSVVLAGCGGSDSTATPSTTDPTTSTDVATPATPSPSAGQKFVSSLYGYAFKAHGWTGTMASAAWDGTGSPGDGDPVVDILVGPDAQRAFVYGEPTKATLEDSAAASRAANAKVHPCPVNPETTRSVTIDREPAILDQMHCPAKDGVFTLTAFVIHAGRAYVFFTYQQPGDEAAMRVWFGSLLKAVSFNA